MAKLKLTEQQQAAVENRGGSLLVSAAAGSGKTKVLVERLFRYVTEDHCHIDDFLIITYTKAAAAELRSKIAAELSKRMAETPEDRHLRSQLLRVYQADIKTVDAFCTALLRENTHLLAQEGERYTLTPDFRVLDENDAKLLRQRVLTRVLERFYEELDEGGALLADTLGAGRDDSALENLVLETYEKLQSHADPEHWLAENRTIWENRSGDFDETPYAAELLAVIRRKGFHYMEALRRAGQSTVGGDLYKGYGEKFLRASRSFAPLAAAQNWEAARVSLDGLEFPRLTTPKGMADDPEVVRLKGLWENAKTAAKKLAPMLAVSDTEAMEDLQTMAPAMTALLKLTADFSDAYRTEKLRMNCADFSDQEHLALRLLVERNGAPTELGRQVAGRYREILVDEYQDTNEVQNAIFRAVSREGKNLFTVGDVKQSIYRFRLADPTIFLDKYRNFTPAENAAEGEDRKILLSKNFRSRGEILDVANFVFSNILSAEMGEMEYGEDESLHFGAEYYPPRKDCETEFHLISAHQKSAANERPVKRLLAEARFTAQRIRQLLDEGYPVTGEDGTLRPCRPEDIVILMRSPGSRSAAFAQALAERDVPCSFEESGDFYQTPEISVTLALLEIVDNPRQDVPLIAVLRSPLFGFSADRLALIRALQPEGDYYDALCLDDGADTADFRRLLEELRLAARDMTADRLLWKLYTECHALAVFGAMEGGAARKENLIALYTYAGQQAAAGRGGLFDFVTQLHDLLEEGRQPPITTRTAGSGVQIMSVHRSKGLEFPVVILTDLHKTFNADDFRRPVLVHPWLGLGTERVDREKRIRYDTVTKTAVAAALTRESKSEEMRILYVALTRAKEKLICVQCMAHGRKRLADLSVLADMPTPPEAVAGAKCPGDWLLLPLLCAPEGEPLRRWAEAEPQTRVGLGGGWQVQVWENPTAAAAREREDAPQEVLPESAVEVQELDYPHQAACRIPTKVTATQLKGRELDEEIAQGTVRRVRQVQVDTPRFLLGERPLSAAQRGTAMHLLMQYLDLNGPDPEEQAASLTARHLLTPEQAASLDLEQVRQFLASPLAQRIRRAEQVYREYRFSLLLPAALYDPVAEPEDELMLQGVVDCAFRTEEGLVIVDFKTDRIRPEEAPARAELYRPQLTAYSQALSRVLETPVAEMVLYFFAPGCEVRL